MQHYAAALQNPSQASILVGLQKTYEAAAALADKQCGAAYVQAGVAGNAGASIVMADKSTGPVASVVALMLWTIML